MGVREPQRERSYWSARVQNSSSCSRDERERRFTIAIQQQHSRLLTITTHSVLLSSNVLVVFAILETFIVLSV